MHFSLFSCETGHRKLNLNVSSCFLQTQFPLLSRLNEAYNELPAFQDAVPEKEPDAPAKAQA